MEVVGALASSLMVLIEGLEVMMGGRGVVMEGLVVKRGTHIAFIENSTADCMKIVSFVRTRLLATSPRTYLSSQTPPLLPIVMSMGSLVSSVKLAINDRLIKVPARHLFSSPYCVP